MVSGVLAGIAGILYAISLRFVNTSVFSMDITLDALLMTIIGGVGTLVGAIIGAGLIEFAHDWLTELAKTIGFLNAGLSSLGLSIFWV